jgi:hypothetical protein
MLCHIYWNIYVLLQILQAYKTLLCGIIVNVFVFIALYCSAGGFVCHTYVHYVDMRKNLCKSPGLLTCRDFRGNEMGYETGK